MKKKILFSHFSFSLILFSFNAKADIIMDYSPQGKIQVEGKIYSNYIAFGSDYRNRLSTSEKLILPSQAKFLDSLFNNNDKELRKEWYKNLLMSEINNISFENFDKSINELQRFIKEDGITLQQLIDYVEANHKHGVLNPKGKMLFDILSLHKNYISRIVELLQIKEFEEKNDKSTSKNSKNQDTNLTEFNDDDYNLIKDPNIDINTKIKIADKYFSTPEYLAKKKSAEFQDDLKDIINEIKEAQLDEHAEALLADIKIGLGAYITKDPKSASDLTPVQAPEGKTTYGVFNAVNPVTSDIGARLNNFVGVSAGSIMERVGAWIKGIYSTGEQKTTGLSDGFKYNLAGGSIGVDVGEQNIVGVAYSFLSNKIESKLKNATKDEIPLHILSLYGMLSPNSELFITGQFQYGFGKVKKTRDTGDSQKNIAKAEPKTDLIRVSGQIGYIFTIPNTDGSIVPTVGINHSTVNMDGYTEKGPGVNRTIEKMSFNRTAGTFGVSYKYTIKNNETIIEPEIHANGDYAFSIKNDDTKITLIKGLDPIVVPSEKTQKFLYSVGASVKFSPSRMVEINGGYDFTGGKEFTAHTGTVKLKVNF